MLLTEARAFRVDGALREAVHGASQSRRHGTESLCRQKG
jgi:hypothetical protein